MLYTGASYAFLLGCSGMYAYSVHLGERLTLECLSGGIQTSRESVAIDLPAINLSPWIGTDFSSFVVWGECDSGLEKFRR